MAAQLDDYARKIPPILTWARACFEKGSIPSMLHLPRDAILCVLPGDRMYQAQRILPGKARPVILHGYGAKRDIPRSLPTFAREGWAPLAMAMVGCGDAPPQRPVVCTSFHFKISPDTFTQREKLLLLSLLWKRVPLPCLPPSMAVRTWLREKTDVPLYHGADHRDSPHSIHRSVEEC